MISILAIWFDAFERVEDILYVRSSLHSFRVSDLLLDPLADKKKGLHSSERPERDERLFFATTTQDWTSERFVFSKAADSKGFQCTHNNKD